MNPNVPGQRYRGPPNGLPMGHGPRPGHDMRNGNMPPGMMSPSGPQASSQSQAAMSRAEKFEDEKKRIIETCFSKADQDGSRMNGTDHE